MWKPLRAFALALLTPIMLVGCAFSPGKFTSSLTILADRSFTFSYKGEVIAVDFAGEMAKGMRDAFKDEEKKDGASTTALRALSWQDDETEGGSGPGDSANDDAEEQARKEAKFKAIAEALTKEAGYRSVAYQGDGVFVIDYEISGTLTHNYLWPYNLDAEVIFPFVVVEMRGRDTVRLKAPAFGENESLAKGNASEGKARLHGVFTLVTDGEIVSQNSEDGATAAGGRKSVTWTATPLSKDAPMAVVRVAPLN